MPPKRPPVPTAEEVLARLRLPREEVHRLFDAVKAREPQRSMVGKAGRGFLSAERRTSELLAFVKRRERVLLDNKLPRFVRAAFHRVQSSVEELRRAVFEDLRIGAAAEAIVFSGLPGAVTDFDSLLLHLIAIVEDRPTGSPEDVLSSDDLSVLCAEFAPQRFRSRKENGRFHRDDVNAIGVRVRSAISKRRALLERETRGVAPDRKRHQRELRAPDVWGPVLKAGEQLENERHQRQTKPKRGMAMPEEQPPEQGALSDAEFVIRASAAPATMRLEGQSREVNLASPRGLEHRGKPRFPKSLRLGSKVLRREAGISAPLRNIKRRKK